MRILTFKNMIGIFVPVRRYMKQYIEHEKMMAVKDKSQAIGDFLEWLKGKVEFATWEENNEYYEDINDIIEVLKPVHRSSEQWLADYFDIDLNKIEQEKQSMLEEIRNANRQ